MLVHVHCLTDKDYYLVWLKSRLLEMKLEEERMDFLLTLREKEDNRFVDFMTFSHHFLNISVNTYFVLE